jgi:hypothetical protein
MDLNETVFEDMSWIRLFQKRHRVDFFWKQLRILGFNTMRKPRNFQLFKENFLTHVQWVGFKILTAVDIIIKCFWNVTTCRYVRKYKRYFLLSYLRQNKEIAGSSEKLVSPRKPICYQTTRSNSLKWLLIISGSPV